MPTPAPCHQKPDSLAFLRAWMSNPMRVGAVAPSGPALAELITRDISAATGPVLELGPGTGIFTRALLARGVAERDLTLVELGSDFSAMLAIRFPEAKLLRLDAARLPAIDENSCFYGAAVSGLPLLSMPPRKVYAILRAVRDRLRPDGALYQFTYGMRPPVPRPILDRLGLVATRTGLVLMNVPPAAVYRISRRPTD